MEILLAGFILTVLMIPITQLIFGGTTRTKVGRDQATAVSLATNIMGQLLVKVPYGAFDPEGAPVTLSGDIWSDVESPGSGPAVSRDQVAFVCPAGATCTAAEEESWKRILDDDADDSNGRVIVRDGTPFEVILFAGQYMDVDSIGASGYNEPDPTEELTFSYFRNPYVPVSHQSRRMVKLDSSLGNEFIPYLVTGADVTQVGTVQDDDVHDPRFRPAWPQGATGTVDGRQAVTVGDFNSKDPDVEWPRHTLDQSDFREDGAFMKLVLGLRWRHGVRSSGGTLTAVQQTRGSGMSKTSKEFWLVSFKAKLEE